MRIEGIFVSLQKQNNLILDCYELEVSAGYRKPVFKNQTTTKPPYSASALHSTWKLQKEYTQAQEMFPPEVPPHPPLLKPFSSYSHVKSKSTVAYILPAILCCLGTLHGFSCFQDKSDLPAAPKALSYLTLPSSQPVFLHSFLAGTTLCVLKSRQNILSQGLPH